MMQDARSSKYTFISLKPLDVPAHRAVHEAYRVIYDDRTAAPRRCASSSTSCRSARGRTEILMSTTGPLIGAAGVLDAEIRLARILVARAPAASP